jgi:signal transduction histidine kinase
MVPQSISTSGTDRETTFGPRLPRLWSLLRRTLGRFPQLSLSIRFLIAATGVLCSAMAILGGWITSEISTSTLKSAAVSSSVFMEMFLEPHVQDLPHEGVLPRDISERLDGKLVDTPLGDRLISVKIWRTDGTVAYSTHRELRGQKFVSPDVTRAAGGEVVAQYNQLNEFDGAFERATGLPLIEVYAPLHRSGSNEVIAVGEYYEHAPWFNEQLQRSEAATWLVVGGTAAAMLGVLFLIVLRGSATIAAQREELRKRMSEARLMARENEELRLAADQARLDANEANEQLLARIGSDLHDGPIQLLSLSMLRLSAIKRKLTTATIEQVTGLVQITGDVLAELRNISAGLSLPEITTISLQEALHLAVFRHVDMTGETIDSKVAELPPDVALSVKICAYRVVQEALSNSCKYADGAPTRVEASVDDQTLRIVVADSGPGMPTEDKVVGGRPRLGIAGIRNRVSALKGTFQIESQPWGGTTISVALPLGHWTRTQSV